MSKTDGLCNAWLNLYFKGTAIPNIADNAASSPLTNLQVSLHTAFPGEAGSQTTSESAYTGYARVAVARGAGWTVTGNTVLAAANIDFGTKTAGTDESIFYWGVGRSSSGVGTLDHWGIFGSNLGPFTATAADVITIPGLTGVAVDNRIAFFPVPGSSLPTGITAGTVYWVKTVATNDITISTTQGGATLDITAAGDGIAFLMTAISVTNGVAPRIASGQTLHTED